MENNFTIRDPYLRKHGRSTISCHEDTGSADDVASRQTGVSEEQLSHANTNTNANKSANAMNQRTSDNESNGHTNIKSTTKSKSKSKSRSTNKHTDTGTSTVTYATNKLDATILDNESDPSNRVRLQRQIQYDDKFLEKSERKRDTMDEDYVPSETLSVP